MPHWITVAKFIFIVSGWGIKLTPTQGCCTGPSRPARLDSCRVEPTTLCRINFIPPVRDNEFGYCFANYGKRTCLFMHFCINGILKNCVQKMISCTVHTRILHACFYFGSLFVQMVANFDLFLRKFSYVFLKNLKSFISKVRNKSVEMFTILI